MILHAQNFTQNWPTCAELTKRHRNCKILQIFSVFQNGCCCRLSSVKISRFLPNLKWKIGLKKCAEFAQNSRKCFAEFASYRRGIFIFWHRILTTLEILDFMGDRLGSWLTRRYERVSYLVTMLNGPRYLHVVCVFSVCTSTSNPNICWMPQWVAVTHSPSTCFVFKRVVLCVCTRVWTNVELIFLIWRHRSSNTGCISWLRRNSL